VRVAVPYGCAFCRRLARTGGPVITTRPALVLATLIMGAQRRAFKGEFDPLGYITQTLPTVLGGS
jgi:hypothetical protein